MKKFFSLLLMSVFAISVGWAAESVFYTLTPATGSNNAYAGNCDVVIGDVTWNVSGNASVTPWRIGGKSLDGVDREVYSKTAMESTISKVSLEVGAASTITVNSLTLTVASDADFTDQLDEVTATFAANSTIDFTPTSGTEWAKDAYYRFTFNVTVSGTSNKFVEFKKATFYTNEDVPEPTAYNITYPDPQTLVGGSVSGPETAVEGATVDIAVTPNTGYVLSSLTYNGNDITSAKSFTMPAEDVTIAASFEEVVPEEDAVPGESVIFKYGTGEEFAQSNAEIMVTSSKKGITIEFAKADGSNDPKWYTSSNGNARVYTGNNIIVTAPSEIESVTFTYDGNYALSPTTVNPGSFSEGVWTVGATSGTLTNGNTARISTITVKLAEEGAATYTVTVADGIVNGTISDITAETATAGTEVYFEVTPAEHYAIENVTVNCVNINQAVELTKEDNIYSFEMPADDVVINATFKQVEFQVALNYNAEQATVDGVVNNYWYAAGDDITFEVTPAEGYQLTGVTITAGNEAIVPDVAENTYSFIMPESDVNINVATELIPAKTYPINVQAMENGSVVADPIAAAIGETVTLTVTPDEGYELETISVTAGREIQGGSGGARAPHVKMWQSQGNIELTKVDDTHYTFVLPEELPNVLTPNYTDNTEFKVSATFKLAPVPTRVITGKVVDKKGNPLAEVSVVALVKDVEPAGISRLKAEGDLSTTTDENGEFSLEVPADQQYDLTFSKNGYKSQTVGEDEVPGTGLVMAKDYPTAIDAIVADENVAGVKYVSVNGQVSDQPFDGVNIVVIEKVDGTKTVTKIRK